LAVLALSGLQTACYSFVPAQPEGLVGGRQARVQLSIDGTRDLAANLGPEVRVITGVVERSSADSVVLQIRELQLVDGQTTTSSGTTVAIARRHIADLRRQVSSPAKTAIAVGVAVGAIVIVYVAARPRGNQGEIIGPGPNPNPVIVPR